MIRELLCQPRPVDTLLQDQRVIDDSMEAVEQENRREPGVCNAPGTCGSTRVEERGQVSDQHIVAVLLA